jgi:hypothetical protein
MTYEDQFDSLAAAKTWAWMHVAAWKYPEPESAAVL